MNSVFTIQQVHTNPRDGSTFLTPYEEYATLAEAVKVARKEFKKTPWLITEVRVVRTSSQYQP